MHAFSTLSHRHFFRGFATCLAVCTGFACTSAELDPEPGPQPGDGGMPPSAQFEIGTGSSFEPLSEGDEVRVIAGIQGGYHIFISLRARDVGTDNVRLEFGVMQADTERSVTGAGALQGRLQPAQDGWRHRDGLLAVLTIAPTQIDGDEVILWATMKAENGVQREARVKVRAVYGRASPDAGPRDRGPDAKPPIVRTADECGPPGTPNADDWAMFCDAPVGHFLSVWGSGPDDVYMVGGVPAVDGFPGETGVFRYNGRQLARIDAGGTERAWWVFGQGPDLVYVSGENGMLLRREAQGAFEAVETDTTQTIFGMWGPSEALLYFTSGDFISPDGQGKLHQLTAEGVSVVDDPVLTQYTGKALFKVWGSGPDDVFVVGDLGTIFHYDGQDWSRLDTPDSETPVLTVSGRNATEVYAVGGRASGVIWQYDGEGFTDATPVGGLPPMMGIQTSSTTAIVVSGETGFVASVTQGSVLPTAPGTTWPLHAIWQDGAGTTWTVGGNFQALAGEAHGVIARKKPVDCPPGSVRGPGFHHLDLQGRSAAPQADGSYAMYDMVRGRIHPDLVHGEHYLLGIGSMVEFSVPLCDDITGRVAFRMPNNDEEGADALHELFVVRPNGTEVLVASALDTEPGSSGYLPFNRSSLPPDQVSQIAATNTAANGTEMGWQEFAAVPAFEVAPRDIYAQAGDRLLYRTTNVSDRMYGLMVWYPQRGLEYQAFIEVEVPEVPGGEGGDPRAPPPEPGLCAPTTAEGFVELGRSGPEFGAFPPAESRLQFGPQGSLMFLSAVRGRGFAAGDPANPLDPTNPVLLIRLALDAPPAAGGRVIADGRWQRGFDTVGADAVLLEVRPTVPVSAATYMDLSNQMVYAEVRVVDAVTGTTYCQDTSFTAGN